MRLAGMHFGNASPVWIGVFRTWPSDSMSRSRLPWRVNVLWSYVRGVLAALLSSHFCSLTATATCLNNSPPIMVLSAPLSTRPVTGTPCNNTVTHFGSLPPSLIVILLTAPSSESEEYRNERGALLPSVMELGSLPSGAYKCLMSAFTAATLFIGDGLPVLSLFWARQSHSKCPRLPHLWQVMSFQINLGVWSAYSPGYCRGWLLGGTVGFSWCFLSSANCRFSVLAAAHNFLYPSAPETAGPLSSSIRRPSCSCLKSMVSLVSALILSLP